MHLNCCCTLYAILLTVYFAPQLVQLFSTNERSAKAENKIMPFNRSNSKPRTEIANNSLINAVRNQQQESTEPISLICSVLNPTTGIHSFISNQQQESTAVSKSNNRNQTNQFPDNTVQNQQEESTEPNIPSPIQQQEPNEPIP